MEYEITYYKRTPKKGDVNIGKETIRANNETEALSVMPGITGWTRREIKSKTIINFKSNEVRLARLSELFDRFNGNKDNEETLFGTIESEFTKQDLIEIIFELHECFRRMGISEQFLKILKDKTNL